MYYWSLTGNWLDMGGFLLLCVLWAAGGWLLTTGLFHLKQRENLIAGLATGFLLFIVLSNLLAQFLPILIAYWLSSLLILISGVVTVLLKRGSAHFGIASLRAWPQIVALLAITVVFTLILRGLAIFDDYYHLPMISVMATGDIPPHFYLDPTLHLPYHYGLQVFAAGMVRLGGFFPWSAWDISRAAVLAFSAMLGWLWIRRLTRSSLAAYLGSGLLVLGGATRWLLLFIPPPILSQMGANLHMDISGLAAGGSLVTDLTNHWPMDGGGPINFPFAFASGIFEPLNMQLGATGAMWEMTILLLLLVWRREKTGIAGSLILGLLLASLALSAEHVYAALFAGMVIIFLVYILIAAIRRRPLRIASFTPYAIPLAASAILVVFQGGFITGGLMHAFYALTGRAYKMVTTDFQGFSLRWPPAMPSGHFGPLSLLNPGQIVILLAETGPALLLLVFAAIYWLRALRKTHRLAQALASGAILSLVFPVFFRYGLDFDITRLVGAALWLSVMLAFPFLWMWLSKALQGYRILAGFGYGVMIYSGLVMLAIELVAIPAPKTTYYLQFGESNFARQYWNRLEPQAQILDWKPERAVLLFGRASFAGEDVYQHAPQWKALVNAPDPARVAASGYSYVYMDELWWQELTPALQSAYDQPCVHIVDQMKFTGNEFRKLYNVEACRP